MNIYIYNHYNELSLSATPLLKHFRKCFNYLLVIVFMLIFLIIKLLMALEFF